MPKLTANKRNKQDIT